MSRRSADGPGFGRFSCPRLVRRPLDSCARRPKITQEKLQTNGQLTFDGFKTLQQIFIANGQQEVVWNMLWQYGYDYDLKLDKSNSETGEWAPGPAITCCSFPLPFP